MSLRAQDARVTCSSLNGFNLTCTDAQNPKCSLGKASSGSAAAWITAQWMWPASPHWCPHRLLFPFSVWSIYWADSLGLGVSFVFSGVFRCGTTQNIRFRLTLLHESIHEIHKLQYRSGDKWEMQKRLQAQCVYEYSSKKLNMRTGFIIFSKLPFKPSSWCSNAVLKVWQHNTPLFVLEEDAWWF